MAANRAWLGLPQTLVHSSSMDGCKLQFRFSRTLNLQKHKNAATICMRRLSSSSANANANANAKNPSSTSLIDIEYADLNLKENSEFGSLGVRRLRQHVNPLKSLFMGSVSPPKWQDIFQDPSLPLMVDVGCGSGRFLIWLAKRFSGTKNFLGLDIRDKLVERSQNWSKELALSNIHFMVANATLAFEALVSTYPGALTHVTILCPDPHFKKRHQKRRILQKPLVEAITKCLARGGQVLVQSDVHEVAVDMRRQFDDCVDSFQHVDTIDPTLCDIDGWLLDSPFGIRTEREIHAQNEGAKIYRRMYEKL